MSYNTETLSLEELVNAHELAVIRQRNNVGTVKFIKALIENIEHFADDSIKQAERYSSEDKVAAEAIISTAAVKVMAKHLKDIQKELDIFKAALER